MAPLNITILGAGISGLTAAIALRQHGHKIALLEKSPTHQEAGAAIHLGPNCSGILSRLGFKAEEVGANAVAGMAQYNGKGGIKMKMDLREVSKQWKNPWLAIHRRDLHRELKRLALEPDGKGEVPELVLGCKVVGIDVESGVVELEDGRRFESEVFIGADGNFSFARRQIDSSVQPYPWGKACYRWLVPREVLVADAETRELIGEEDWFGEISEADRRIVMYPCRNNTMMNFVAFVPNAESSASGADWNQESNKSLILKAFENFFPEARKMLSYAPDEIPSWQLYDMETLQHWSKGRLAVIGDAAHPFLPFLGRGGAMAIEDAASISQLLPGGTPASDVPKRLKLYEDIRHERVTWVQEQTRINALDEDKRPATKGGFVMLVYCHNHDEWENSHEKLEEHLRMNGSTNGV